MSNILESDRTVAAECAALFGGNGLTTNQQVELVAARLAEYRQERQAPLLAALQGVLNSACHPEVAYRAVMVNLGPIREAIAGANKA